LRPKRAPKIKTDAGESAGAARRGGEGELTAKTRACQGTSSTNKVKEVWGYAEASQKEGADKLETWEVRGWVEKNRGYQEYEQ